MKILALLIVLCHPLPALAAAPQEPVFPPAENRLVVSEFFERYPSPQLTLLCGIPSKGDFGVRRPGDVLQESWIVSAKGTDVGMTHKQAPWPTVALVCRVSSGQKLVIPDRGCG